MISSSASEQGGRGFYREQEDSGRKWPPGDREGDISGRKTASQPVQDRWGSAYHKPGERRELGQGGREGRGQGSAEPLPLPGL